MKKMIRQKLIDFMNNIIVIDGANVCWHRQNKFKKPKLNNLFLILNELKKLGFQEKDILIFCDSSLKYDIDNRAKYYSMLKR